MPWMIVSHLRPTAARAEAVARRCTIRSPCAGRLECGCLVVTLRGIGFISADEPTQLGVSIVEVSSPTPQAVRGGNPPGTSPPDWRSSDRTN
ncbi:uncharacterized protein EI90DRAFT_3034529 [Cantharellus anzutake]|uniref:uncharacterized protein n=1 Tax=Cantharellus anzutake TaxID=1750568 RepID=UPI001904630B|nr:uncharacterized protein EI90DRAFT_3034529 [Cantharellus anzutake]KAF8341584.1 hypothetical protein EI90DRAFT_3034529 [Cantharellus anzutake]